MFLFVFSLLLLLGSSMPLSAYLVIVRSQPTPLEMTLADSLRKSLLEDGLPREHILLEHELPQSHAFWTYLPLFLFLGDTQGLPDYEWLVLVDPMSHVTLSMIEDFTTGRDTSSSLYLGIGIMDPPTDLSIRHHYSSKPYPYPLVGTDLYFTHTLVHQVYTALVNHHPSPQFHIDAEWELAVYLHDTLDVDLTPLSNEPSPSESCRDLSHLKGTLSHSLQRDQVAIGVKTAQMYHETRIQEALGTWASDAPLLYFYSNGPHPTIPMVYEVIPDTKSGHCGKTMALLRDLHHRSPSDVKWFVVVDDDTLLSVPRLMNALDLLDPSISWFAGERYGYGLTPNADQEGYNYMTGGSGMILSRPALEMLLECNFCQCPTAESPDDMLLGMFMRHLGIPAVNIRGMRQAAPSHYHSAILAQQSHISFHSCRKGWGCDYKDVYRRYLISD